MSNTTITLTLTSSQVAAANSIARNMKRNKADNAEVLCKKVLNNYLTNNFEVIAKASADLAAKQYDSAVIFGAKFDKTREQFIKEQTEAAQDILFGLKNGEPKE